MLQTVLRLTLLLIIIVYIIKVGRRRFDCWICMLRAASGRALGRRPKSTSSRSEVIAPDLLVIIIIRVLICVCQVIQLSRSLRWHVSQVLFGQTEMSVIWSVKTVKAW